MSRITDRSSFPIKNFRSTGIHDDATSNTITITDSSVTVDVDLVVTGTITADSYENLPTNFTIFGRSSNINISVSNGTLLVIGRSSNVNIGIS